MVPKMVEMAIRKHNNISAYFVIIFLLIKDYLKKSELNTLHETTQVKYHKKGV